MAKIKRNDPCPCGSGKKYKRCCLGKGLSASGFSREERWSALEKLESFTVEFLLEEKDKAHDIFFERSDDSPYEMDPMWTEQSDAAYDMWLYVDYRLQGGEFVVDRFLGKHPLLTPGERLYLELLRNTTMRLYEIVDLSPGETVTLRDVLDNTRVTVNERSGSRSMQKYALIAARIITRGASGGPEIEMGVLHIPDLIRTQVISQLESHREAYRKKYPHTTGAEYFKEMTTFFHDAWMSCIMEPPIPPMANTDGEEMVETSVRFDILDYATLEAALDGAAEIERTVEMEPGWIWTGKNKKGKPVILGELLLGGEVLTLACNSTQRAERGRRMIEAIAAGAIRHRTTVHENLEKKLREAIRTGQVGRKAELPPEKAISRPLQDALVLDALGRHYRNWLDEKIPKLDDQTPREAATNPALHPQLFELLHGLERMYQQALQEAKPAYDPSWMWSELGFEDYIRVTHPPQLAHERMAAIVPGLGELIRGVAENLRNQPGFDDASTLAENDAIRTNLKIQRFLRDRSAGHDTAEAPPTPAAESLAAHMAYMINFELHRRKTFWVDDSLAYLLAKTNLEIPGSDLRAPFASFALVFTDRFVLSLGERLLSVEPGCPLAGYFLRIVTVYVKMEHQDPDRTLHLCFAFDATGADPPHLVTHEITLQDDSLIRPLAEDPAPIEVEGDEAVPDVAPFRQLLHVTLSAILYATSASVSPQPRSKPSIEQCGKATSDPEKPSFTNENVFFLPGAIEISRLREFQELERISSGRKLLHRFMVRGHWRRAAPGWRDQRVRWIAPHWKGPDIGAIIERTYKLKA